MRGDGDFPLVEASARGLGVRVGGPRGDVHPDSSGRVHPGEGMSVAPDDPLSLAEHRRPPEFLGSGRDPIWQIIEEDLPEGLTLRNTSSTHGQVEPDVAVPVADYSTALASSQLHWSRTAHG
jgi:hypothetical protein